jgi:hypothetical protein
MGWEGVDWVHFEYYCLLRFDAVLYDLFIPKFQTLLLQDSNLIP